MANPTLTSLLETLSRKIDLPGLKTAEDGTCLLGFDGSITVEISVDETEPAHLVLFTDLGLVEEGRRARLYPEFLEANAMSTSGVVGVLGDAGLAVLSYREVINGMSPERFELLLRSFVDQAEEWKHRLAEDEMAAVDESSVERIPRGVQEALDQPQG